MVKKAIKAIGDLMVQLVILVIHIYFIFEQFYFFNLICEFFWKIFQGAPGYNGQYGEKVKFSAINNFYYKSID